jgi:hypothetical protein
VIEQTPYGTHGFDDVTPNFYLEGSAACPNRFIVNCGVRFMLSCSFCNYINNMITDFWKMGMESQSARDAKMRDRVAV